jgi:hypothetical protein
MGRQFQRTNKQQWYFAAERLIYNKIIYVDTHIQAMSRMFTAI